MLIMRIKSSLGLDLLKYWADIYKQAGAWATITKVGTIATNVLKSHPFTAVSHHNMAINTPILYCLRFWRPLYGYGYGYPHNCIGTIRIQPYAIYCMVLSPIYMWSMGVEYLFPLAYLIL